MEIIDNLFWEKVNKTDGCWLWTGSINEKGYGCVRRRKIKPEMIKAHRYSYYLKNGHFPVNFCCHHCDVPACVNPEHLFDGTASDNMQDMISKGRKVSPCSKGEKNPNSKLTKKNVEQIRLLLDTLNNKQIASFFGVHHATISLIRVNKGWTK